jgi:hypothetical protein
MLLPAKKKKKKKSDHICQRNLVPLKKTLYGIWQFDGDVGVAQ